MSDDYNVLSIAPVIEKLVQFAARAILMASILLTVALSPKPTAAAVLEIGPGGSHTIYDAPSITTAEGVRPITVEIPAPVASREMRQLLVAAAQRYAIDEQLLRAVTRKESGFRANAISPKGAVGPMQLMAGTARDLGVDCYNPSQNVFGSAAYLRQMLDRFHGDVSLALAAYNAGPGAVERNHGIPAFPETRRYVSAILGQAGQNILPSSLVINR